MVWPNNSMGSILKNESYIALFGFCDLDTHASGDMTVNNYRMCYFESHNLKKIIFIRIIH